MVSANVSKVAHVLSGVSRTLWLDCSIFWTCLPKESSIKSEERLPGCNRGRQGTCLLTSYLSSSDLPRSLWWMPLCTRCLTITSVLQEEPHVLGKPRENWTPDEEQWTLRVSATVSLLRRYSNKTQERAMHVLSFTVSLQASKIPQTDYRILIWCILRRYMILCFAKCNENGKLNLEKKSFLKLYLVSIIWLSQIIKIFFKNYRKKYTMTSHM